MFGFRFFNTAKPAEKLIPFTIGKGNHSIADKAILSPSKTSRIRPAFLDARFARIKRNKPADESYVKPVTEPISRKEALEDSVLSFQQQGQHCETKVQQAHAREKAFMEVASPKIVRYSKKIANRSSRFQLQTIELANAAESQITKMSSIYQEAPVSETSDFTEASQLNFQNTCDPIEPVETGETMHAAKPKPVAPQKIEVVSYRPKPLITRLTKHRRQQAKSTDSINPDRDESVFSSQFSIEKEAFGSTAGKPAVTGSHKWPNPPKSFNRGSFLNDTGIDSGSSSLNSIANAIASSMNRTDVMRSSSATTPQRQVSIQDLTDGPSFMRSEETKKADYQPGSETVDLKPWSEKLDKFFSNSANNLKASHSGSFGNDTSHTSYEWKPRS